MVIAMMRPIVIAAVLAGALASAPVAAETADQSAIRHRLMSEFDKPQQRLTVEPVVVSDIHAIAGWMQGEMGGRALLRKKDGAWMLVLCAGDDLKSASTLVKVGLTEKAATELAAGLATAERAMPPERLALLSKFEGLVMMDAGGAHPPSHSGQGHPPAGHHPHGHK